MISLVYAQSRNGIIGKGGGLPWHISSDLKRFKELTMGKPVIMGRKTWDSLPRKPLPGRINIVITRQKGFKAEGAIVAGTVNGALHHAGYAPEVCVIGGAEIYHQFAELAQRIYLTEVDMDAEGDAVAPRLDISEWREVTMERHAQGPKDDAAFTLKVLERLKPAT
jgi:dihydrofolate reductase